MARLIPGNYLLDSLRRWLTVLIIAATAAISSQAQSIRRECIAGGVTATTADGIHFSQSIGQCYSTVGYYAADLSVHPGFQQSMIFSLSDLRTSPEIKLDVFPNPAAYAVTIVAEKGLVDAVVRAYDTNGRLVFQDRQAELKTYLIDCSTWSNGIYSILLSDSRYQSQTAKLIIAK